ncbi:TetR/AcrR family transcriptional regulator [Micrococcus luteus]
MHSSLPLDKEDLSSPARLRMAALELFAERGVEGTSVREIAQRAGVAPGLVRHHFGSKAGLTRAVDDGLLRLIATTLDDVPLTGSVQEVSAARDAAFADLLTEHPVAAAYVRRSLLESNGTDESLLDRLVDLTTEQTARLRESGFAPRRSLPSSVFATVIRQIGHLVVGPSAERIWHRLAETQEGVADQPSPRATIVVEPSSSPR